MCGGGGGGGGHKGGTAAALTETEHISWAFYPGTVDLALPV